MVAAGHFPPDGGGAVELFRQVRRRPPRLWAKIGADSNVFRSLTALAGWLGGDAGKWASWWVTALVGRSPRFLATVVLVA
jgi:hypothetical protein